MPEARSSRTPATALSARPWEQLPPELGSALRPDVPGTVEAIIEAIRATVPAYSRPLDDNFGATIRSGVERALGDFLDEIGGGSAAGPHPGTYEDLGRLEAREGRTMEALLAAYRVGARVSWRRASALADEAGFPPRRWRCWRSPFSPTSTSWPRARPRATPRSTPAWRAPPRAVGVPW